MQLICFLVSGITFMQALQIVTATKKSTAIIIQLIINNSKHPYTLMLQFVFTVANMADFILCKYYLFYFVAIFISIIFTKDFMTYLYLFNN